MQEIVKIESIDHPNVVLRTIRGHFVTPNSHVNYFLDMTMLKSRLSEASLTARELSRQIAVNSTVDTILCIDGCEIIGAFLAEELTKSGIYSINAHKTIYIVSPEYSPSGHILFRENILPMIKGKNVLLLLASVTTGQTIIKSVHTLNYYGAKISGVSAIFSAANTIMEFPIRALFTTADIPDYKTYAPDGCPMCKDNQPIDAFANAYGYSTIK